MNDLYHEQIVTGKIRRNDLILFIALWVAAIAVFLFVPSSFAIIIVVALVAVDIIFVYKRLKIEYEYTLVNTEMEISAIFAKSSRKTQYTFDLKDAEVVAPKGSNHLGGMNGMKIRDYTSRDPQSNDYGIVLAAKEGRTCVLISPDADMLKQMKNWTGVRFNEF